MNKVSNHFMLDPRITFLNHGSFGATPKSVMKVYQKWQNYSETQPVQFYGRQLTGLLAEARRYLAQLLHVSENDIVYVPNATTGINIVARSLDWSPGEILLTTNHEYGAIEKTWKFLSSKSNFSVQINCISIPLLGNEQILHEVFSNFSNKIKALSISHITSPTALKFPIKQICEAAFQKGIITIIDGAHAPGQIDLDLNDINCDFYVGNLHKWLCAPKGSAFLYAHPRVQAMIEPLIVSWGWQNEKPGVSAFIDELEWSGTRDISAYLSVPEAISFHKLNIEGKPQFHCQSLAQLTQTNISEITHLPPMSQSDGKDFTQMASSIIPSDLPAEALKNILYNKYKIEIPVIPWNEHILLRYSYQIYNDEQDMITLILALRELLQ